MADNPISLGALAGPLAIITKGWRTSEGQMTAGTGALYALGTVAEAMGWIPAGSTVKLMPAAVLVGTYILGRTGIKLFQARQVQALPLTPEAPAPALAGLAQAIQGALDQSQAKTLANLVQSVRAAAQPGPPANP